MSLSDADVIAFARASIAGYKVPKKVLFVDELPKSGTGKVQKRVISDELWAGHGRRV